jgi:hypothetical protein
MASLAERVYMDLMARGKDIETARCWQVSVCSRTMCVSIL